MKNKNIAFTLIELLVTIVIVGILSAISVSTYGGYIEKARIAKGQVFADNLRATHTEYLLASFSFNKYSISDTPLAIQSLGSDINLATFGLPTIVEGLKGMKAMRFNGSTQGVRTGIISDVKAISMWVKINSSQGSGWDYFVDARTGLTNGYFSDVTIHSSWKSLYINGEKKAMNWNSIPKDVWTHVFLVARNNFTDNVNIMSRYTNTETLAGYLGDIKFYSKTKL